MEAARDAGQSRRPNPNSASCLPNIKGVYMNFIIILFLAIVSVIPVSLTIFYIIELGIKLFTKNLRR